MSELFQMVAWAFLIFFGMMWFHHWATMGVKADRWEWMGPQKESEIERQQFAPHYNRLTESALPVVMGDYEYSAFQDDYPRDAA